MKKTITICDICGQEKQPWSFDRLFSFQTEGDFRSYTVGISAKIHCYEKTVITGHVITKDETKGEMDICCECFDKYLGDKNLKL